MSMLSRMGRKRRHANLTDLTDANEGGAGYAVRFSPNNSYIACCGNSSSKQIAMFSWSGTAVSEITTVNVGSTVTSASWHPNGNFLATSVSNSTNSVNVYSWNGSALSSVETLNFSPSARWVDWHPNGNFLAVSTLDTSQSIVVYSWNGTDTLTAVETLNLGAASHSCKWSPDGTYLYVGSQSSGHFTSVYSWNGTDTLAEVAYYNSGSTNDPQSAVWTTDNAYLFTADIDATTTTFRVYAFSGSALTLKQTINAGLNAFDIAIFNNRYIAGVAYGGSVTSVACVKFYSFSRTTEQLAELDTLSYTAYGALSVAFDKWGLFLAIGMYGETNKTLRIAKIYG